MMTASLFPWNALQVRDADVSPTELAEGSLVLMHGNLVHKSYENRSEVSRHAYTLHVIEGDYAYPADNW
jgi:phytanoyl-CoA hydroxylase